MTILTISAKCSDCCYSSLTINDKLVKEKDGYVPKLMPGGDSDYITIDINVDTGEIMNWRVPSQQQIDEYIGD